jgi:hypothetical protein
MDIKAIYQRYVAEKFARLKARIFKDYAVEEIQEHCQEAEKLRMDNGSGHDRKKKGGFLWGTALTWAVSIPCIIGICTIFTTFRRIPSEHKAVGLVLFAIVSGAKVYATFGFILGLLLPIVAIVLLTRSFSSGHRMRTLVSLLHIGWNAVIIAVVLHLR